ncbi:MAG TPA: pyrroloquinoline quinone biosynthesis peptide chaperone PqqD [Polyangia bacterium]|jgi:pyrroloquinoline quinone biosynthesis protein D
MIVSPGSRPRLAPRARLRLDRLTGQTVLLYPERGLVLNTIGQAVLELCAADHTVEDIVTVLNQRYTGDQARVRAEVLTFLQQLADRGLLEERAQ